MQSQRQNHGRNYGRGASCRARCLSWSTSLPTSTHLTAAQTWHRSLMESPASMLASWMQRVSRRCPTNAYCDDLMLRFVLSNPLYFQPGHQVMPARAMDLGLQHETGCSYVQEPQLSCSCILQGTRPWSYCNCALLRQQNNQASRCMPWVADRVICPLRAASSRHLALPLKATPPEGLELAYDEVCAVADEVIALSGAVDTTSEVRLHVLLFYLCRGCNSLPLLDLFSPRDDNSSTRRLEESIAHWVLPNRTPSRLPAACMRR